MSGGIRARGTNKLSDARIKAFIADARAGKAPTKKLADGGGLYITVTTTGSAVWRIKYRYGGKERVYADIGAYPEAGLQKAREERDRVREMLRQGRDPVKGRKIDQIESAAASGQTFGTVAEEWLRERQKGWAAIHYDKSKRALERDVLPDLGKMPVREITPAMIALVIKSVIKRGAGDTAGKILQQISGILRLAQASGYSAENPADPVRELIPRKKFTARRPAILEWNGLGAVLRGAEAARLSPAVRMAHRLCAFTAARISNVVQAQWSEFELDAEVPVWVIPRAQMKAQDREHDHKIILGPTIATELRAWRNVIGGTGYLFPSPVSGKHITRESIEKVYRVTLGLDRKHSPHGWRSALSTLARDNEFERDVVELALDHIHDNDVARAYDRGARLEQRIKLMNWWDAQLSQTERGADVIELKKQKA